MGFGYFEDIFSNTENDFNKCYYNVFLSRCQINGNYTYFEHNEMLSANEIECVRLVAIKLSDLACQIEKELSSLVNNLSKPWWQLSLDNCHHGYHLYNISDSSSYSSLVICVCGSTMRTSL